MAITTKKSVLAVKVEATEGTPVFPTAATDYIALQPDFDMDPAQDVLDNEELKSSIGASKPIIGLENPTTTLSHYLRHSGVEGQSPNYGEILKAAFGDEDVEGTEYDTVAASTTTVTKVDAGEGAQFQRGQGLLFKHGSNPYEIRCVDSVSTDDLNNSFAVNNAPATSTNLGKAVTYSPVDDGHQTLTLTHYSGNGGAIQQMAGVRVSNAVFNFPAGELINATYTMDGVEYFFNPIEIEATDIYLDFTDDGGTFAAVIDAKTYKNPNELAAAITTAMNTVQTAETHSCVYNNSGANKGKFTISTSTSAVLSLLWNTGGNAANTVGDKLGFSVAADDTGATTYDGDNAISFAAPQTPSYDSADPLAAKANEVLLGDQDDNVCFEASVVEATLGNEKRDILSVCARSGKSGSIIQARTATVTLTALLEQYDADRYDRFQKGTQTRFQYNFGTKSGGNWVAGKCGALYVPTATIISHKVTDDDGLQTLELELQAYVNENGDGEVYLTFV